MSLKGRNDLRSMDDRLSYILNEVNRTGRVKVTELSEELGCSEVTIRNDIKRLDEQGVLKRVFGGAVKMDAVPQSLPTNITLQNHSQSLTLELAAGSYYVNKEYKESIAETAFSLIDNQDAIMLDDSTTCAFLARIIRNHPEKKVSVVTNSLLSAVVLANLPHVSLYFLGGNIKSTPAAATGSITTENVKTYHVNKFFSGINKLNLEKGIASVDTSHAMVKRAMIDAADETYILVDHTKFGNAEMFSVCGMDRIKCIITDNAIEAEIIEKAKAQNVEILIGK